MGTSVLGPSSELIDMRFVINLAVLLASLAVTALCLWSASHLAIGYGLIAAWAFSVAANAPFALMHEAVHGIGAASSKLNRLLGTVAGWAFPTSFSMQSLAHLGHHRRNRTDAELYDYYLPHQSKAVRNFWLFSGNLFGLYYWSVIAGNMLYFLAPWAFRSRFFVDRIAPALGFGPYVADLVCLSPFKVWREIVLAFGYQALLIWGLGLTWRGVLLCYGAFALHWSVLQYADHAWSARDTRSGAWDLVVLPPFRWLALNYHYHRTHHEHPQIPWFELPSKADPSLLQPSFWRVYLSLWGGVRPAPPMGAQADLAFLFPSQKPAQEPAD
jgi:fatty acid desaturase